MRPLKSFVPKVVHSTKSWLFIWYLRQNLVLILSHFPSSLCLSHKSPPLGLLGYVLTSRKHILLASILRYLLGAMQ